MDEVYLRINGELLYLIWLRGILIDPDAAVQSLRDATSSVSIG